MKNHIAKIFIGVLCVTFGVLYILSNVGVIPIKMTEIISNYWPGIIGIISIYWILSTLQSRLIRKSKFIRIYWAVAFILMSLVMIENRIHLYFVNPINLWGIVLSLVVIFVGILLVFFKSFKATIHMDHDYNHKHKHKFKYEYDDNDDDDDDDETVSGESSSKEDSNEDSTEDKSTKKGKTFYSRSGLHIGQEHFIGEICLGKSPWALEDSSYKVSVGDIDVDLTTAFLKDGETKLNLNGWVGDIEVKIPEDLAVDITASINIGEVNMFGKETKVNKNRNGNIGSASREVHYRSEEYDDAVKKVKINAVMNIGEISIERV